MPTQPSSPRSSRRSGSNNGAAHNGKPGPAANARPNGAPQQESHAHVPKGCNRCWTKIKHDSGLAALDALAAVIVPNLVGPPATPADIVQQQFQTLRQALLAKRPLLERVRALAMGESGEKPECREVGEYVNLLLQVTICARYWMELRTTMYSVAYALYNEPALTEDSANVMFEPLNSMGKAIESDIKPLETFTQYADMQTSMLPMLELDTLLSALFQGQGPLASDGEGMRVTIIPLGPLGMAVPGGPGIPNFMRPNA